MVANYQKMRERLALKPKPISVDKMKLKQMPIGKGPIRVLIEAIARKQGYEGYIHLGIVGNEIIERAKSGKEFVYIDHAYFKRGWEKGNFRVCRNWVHQTQIFKRPDDRFKKWDVKIEPWRKTGSKVVIIPPTVHQKPMAVPGWVEATEATIKQNTQRPVVIKWEKGGLREYLQDAWAVVTWGSVAGVEAALMGVPVFAGEKCPAHPVTAGPLEKIETPEYAENRHEWACSLAYASWNWEEVERINFKDYWYDMREGA